MGDLGKGRVQQEAGGLDDSLAALKHHRPTRLLQQRLECSRTRPPRPALEVSPLGFPTRPAALPKASGGCCPLVSVALYAGRRRPVANSQRSFLKSLVTLKMRSRRSQRQPRSTNFREVLVQSNLEKHIVHEGFYLNWERGFPYPA